MCIFIHYKTTIMKLGISFLALAALLFSFDPGAYSQNHSLQYNKVKLIGTTDETVPVDKVWKIENILPSVRLTTSVQNGSTTTNCIIVVNGINIYWATSDATGSLYGNGQTGFAIAATNIGGSPVWLPAGTSLRAGAGVQYISVVEFNEVP